MGSSGSALADKLVLVLGACLSSASASKTGYDILNGTAQHCFVIQPPDIQPMRMVFCGTAEDMMDTWTFSVEGFVRDNGNPVDFFEQQYVQMEAVRSTIESQNTLGGLATDSQLVEGRRAPTEWNIAGVLWQELNYTIKVQCI